MESDIVEEDIDGSIVSIHVRNFFCHDNLEVNFNRNVNFIVGRNGSGKSAILTALVVGLGGRASATNRGSNLHSFIKKGANSATIEIKIKNSSPKSYKHHIYGDFITIVRTINASGGSSYKVKTASGDVVSTKFEEVNSIILAHDIQVDNPISVLNQDDARSFHASDAKKKYSLFRKATNLDQTENNYNVAIENCQKATAIWNRKNDACADLEKEYKKWKASHEQLRSRDEIKALKTSLQNEYYWSEISELELEAGKIQEEYDRQKANMDKLREKLSKMEQNYGSKTSAIDELRNILDQKNLEKTALEQEIRALESEVNSVQAAWRGSQHSAGKYSESLNREKRKVADLEREIQYIGSGAVESNRAQLEERSARATAAAEAARARYGTAQHEAAQARDAVAHAQAQADAHAQRQQRHRDTLRQLQQQLRELESRGNDSLAVYGSNMVELCQRVTAAANKGHFSQKPRGPIGAYLKVKEKKWGGALEHILGGNVQTFCVNNAEDSRKLNQIINQVYGSGPKPSVTCSKFLPRMHDVRRGRVRAPGFLSALDSLDVPDPVVANFLIDNAAMERVLLVPEHDDAIRLSDNEENVPENLLKIVTLDCTEYHPAPNYRSYGGSGRKSRFLHLSTAERKKIVKLDCTEYHPAPNYRSYGGSGRKSRFLHLSTAERKKSCCHLLNIVTLDCTEYHPAPNYRSYGGSGRKSRFLHLSTAERKKQVIAEISEAESTLQSLEAKAEQLNQEAKEARDIERAASKALQALLTEQHQKDKAARLAAEALNQQQQPQHAVLLDELNISKERVQTLQRQVEELATKETQYRQTLDEHDVRMKKTKHKLAELNTSCRSMREEIDQEQMKVDQGVTVRKTQEQRLREDNIKLTQVQAILEDKQRVIVQKIEAAEKLCQRVENPRDKAIVTNELKKIQLKLSSIRSDGLTEAEVTERLLHVERKYRRTKRSLEKLKDLIHSMTSTAAKHLQICHEVQTTVARYVQQSFQSILLLRNYSGRMEMDHVRGTLEVLCTARETSEERRANTTLSLSGGERSYSTVAFIMALWDCVEIPFCFMDEFDVFMDNVNRKVVLTLLINHAMKNTRRQFVFLTPQDASSVTAGPKISIHLMADPRP
ncbi:structural maintenance of chromosomes protein 6 [Helicoverpa armigera]|uniref:structural maintenance of chromosomes protein 6 n=1 Tax=Helicoverpa armigera TaxID=29058 RepID=UPI003082981F